ncbi:TetR family transcriptional regulator [Knoellia subterranea]|uniref:TetR family transcriptional regulator n=1 Tax=Knoellia subterranea KCTC 19937 TaxID=1385521 RepID=A0A0A0JRC7_9MICO|nr:TetR family transcriptional regulator [Knoellia subterranea]KGN38587.1 TetR family transcriptional regulator [Knoellia subterranea KCTC 19937]
MTSTTSTPSTPNDEDTVVDGRSSRWAEHRAQRRKELVEATLRAIRDQGAGVGIDGIASGAGTSKTVFYRHFTDRAGLYSAVAERVNQIILRNITKAVGGDFVAFTGGQSETSAHPRVLLAAAVDAYLSLVEDDPEVYRFIVAAPLVPPSERTETLDLASSVSQVVAVRIGTVIAVALEARGRDTAPAATWGHAVVGMVRAAGDEWLRAGAAASGTPRETLKEHLTELIWGGLSSAWPTADATPDKE